MGGSCDRESHQDRADDDGTDREEGSRPRPRRDAHAHGRAQHHTQSDRGHGHDHLQGTRAGEEAVDFITF